MIMDLHQNVFGGAVVVLMKQYEKNLFEVRRIDCQRVGEAIVEFGEMG